MYPFRARPSALGRTVLLALMAFSFAGAAFAHGVAEGDQGYIEQTSVPQIGAFLYLGAKHMVT
ncbi:HupE/UreJ family protein, partial [Escherichia coli]